MGELRQRPVSWIRYRPERQRYEENSGGECPLDQLFWRDSSSC